MVTEYVLVEVGNAFAKRDFRPLYTRLLSNLQSDPDAKIVPSTQELFQSGSALFTQRLDKDWSLTDCISFVVMRQHGITEALTGDRHFEQAGFKALLK